MATERNEGPKGSQVMAFFCLSAGQLALLQMLLKTELEFIEDAMECDREAGEKTPAVVTEWKGHLIATQSALRWTMRAEDLMQHPAGMQ